MAKVQLRSSTGNLIPPSWMEHARIPKRFWEAECDKQKFDFYLKGLPVNYHHGFGLLILGRNGAGKTYSAVGIMKEMMRFMLLKKYPPKILFITASDLVKALQPGSKDVWFDEERTINEVVANRDVLVIDDLGQEYRGSGTGFAELGLINTIRHRSQECLVTIITSNLNKDQLRIQYGEGFISLIAECTVPIELKGEDLRKKKVSNE